MRTSHVSVATAAALLTGLVPLAAAGREPSAGGGGRTATAASAGAAEPQAQRQIACLRDHGVPLLDGLRWEGTPQIDKRRAAPEQVGRALRQCGPLLETRPSPSGPTAAVVERLRRQAACLRVHGLRDYPDPDPRTGLPEGGESTAARLKADPRLPAAMTACRGLDPVPGRGVVGG